MRKFGEELQILNQELERKLGRPPLRQVRSTESIWLRQSICPAAYCAKELLLHYAKQPAGSMRPEAEAGRRLYMQGTA